MTRSSCFHLSQPHKLNQTVSRSGMFHEYMWLILHLGRPEGSRYSAGKVGTAWTDVKPAFSWSPDADDADDHKFHIMFVDVE